MTLPKERLAYIDWLRALAILGVLIYHSARPFIPDDPWHINNAETSNLLEEFNFFLSRFRMPLLFFISGSVTWLMMKNRSAGSFILLRLKRLFLPLVAGMLLVIPPQVYFERVHQGYTGSFWEFYSTLFQSGSYPKGNLSWHHLWFIAYLFVYDLLFAPFFAWCKSNRADQFKLQVSKLSKGTRIYWLMVPSVLIYSAFILNYPDTNALIDDPLYFVYWLLFLLAGFLCLMEPKLMESLERNRRLSLSVAFLLLLLINGLRWNEFSWFDGSRNTDSWLTYLYLARQPIHTWFWIFALVGYGRKYLNKQHPSISYINQFIYPFYILHQTIIVILAYYVVQTTDTIALKWAFLTFATFFLSLLIFHLFIRPFYLTRILFGMKTDPVKFKSGEENLKTIVT
jgi:peptidoglycan/LPS O-acetylase OafA/YrhL